MRPSIDQPRPLFESLETRQLLSAGQLDSAFGNGGTVQTNLGLSGASGVAVQADGKILVSAGGDGFQGFNLVRYNADGNLDTSFGDDGVVTALHDDTLVAMVVQSDGKIVLAGFSRASDSAGSTMSTVLTRYNADGTLDTTFGDNGVVSLPGDTYPNNGAPRATFSPGNVKLAAQADGKIVLTQVLGDDGTTSGADLVVIRLTDAGTLDDSFGVHGKAVVELGVMEIPQDLALQGDGKIVIVIDGHSVVTSGNSTSWPSYNDYLIRLNTDGSMDTTFGAGGVVTEPHTTPQIYATKIAIGLDGKILFIGEDYGGPNEDQFLIRYNADGSRDTSFGTGGKLVLSPGLGGSYADVLVQPDGKILLTGETTGANDRPSILSQRLNDDGSLDSSYGDGGTTAITVGGQFDFGRAMALQQDGSVVIVGFADKTHDETNQDLMDIAMTRLLGDAGAAGSKHASLRRGKDQQTEYLGRTKTTRHHRSPKRIAMELAAARKSHRSPKRIAMELAAQQSHRSPKRIAMELAAKTFNSATPIS